MPATEERTHAIGEPRRPEYVYRFLSLPTGGFVATTIVTRAPTRIDFGGGWTDVPPYSDEVGGFVCNVAIARYATVSLSHGDAETGSHVASNGDRAIITAAARRFRMDDVRVSVTSDFPIGAGLGGSSAVGVATVAAFAALRGQNMNPSAIAELSRDIEIGDVGIPGGRQDHYAAAYGGALGLRFSAAGVDVGSIPLSEKLRAEIERRCIIIYTGQSRVSGETITAVMRAYSEREPRVLNALNRMREIAEEMANTLSRGAFDRLAQLVTEQWMHQRALHPTIPTPLIDDIIARAEAAGSVGAKALGASGGGCVLVMSRADRVDAVRKSIESLGEVLPFTIARDGVERCD
jgi:D-glycero-alpha-D-manno-heptose-7-phosphate kinase